MTFFFRYGANLGLPQKMRNKLADTGEHDRDWVSSCTVLPSNAECTVLLVMVFEPFFFFSFFVTLSQDLRLVFN